MPETALAKVNAPTFWSTTGQVVTMSTLDNVNGNSIVSEADALLIVQNPTGGALTFTVTSQPISSSGRSQNISQSIAAGEIRIFRLTKDGWENASGLILTPTGLSASLKCGVVKLG